VCQDQGLTGDQGVIIPAANARHLMLKPEVVAAVAQGRFRVWAVRTVDEGLALLTGLPAGERRADGSFPEGSVHARVQQRLSALAARLVAFGGGHRPATPAVPVLAGATNGRPEPAGGGIGGAGTRVFPDVPCGPGHENGP
jgi:hypothetical protein